MHSKEYADYSLFWSDGWQPNDEPEFAGLSLDDFIAVCTKEFGRPVAWMLGHSSGNEYLADRAASIKAGRRVKQEGDRYIAVIPDSDGLSDALSEQAKHLKADPIEAPAQTLGDLLRPYLSGEKQAVVHGKFTMTPTLDAMEADPNAAMIARDGPALDYEALEREHFGDPDKQTGIYAPKSTAHPPIAGLMQENGFSHKLGSADRG